MDWRGQNWIKITTDAEENLIDLCQVETATKKADGAIRLWMKSGRFLDITGPGGNLVTDMWERLEDHAKLEKPKA